MNGIATRSPILAALTESDRGQLLSRAVPRTLGAGDVLRLAGETHDTVYLLVFGVVKLVGRDESGAETVLGLQVAGDLVGDDGAVGCTSLPLDAIAATRLHTAALDGRLFAELVSGSPRAALALARVVADRARYAYAAALDRAHKPAPARLAGRLLHLAELLGEHRHGMVELEVPVTQADLGSLAGMSRESACKTLRALRSHGILDYRGRRLRILRPDALERIRCAGRA